MFKSFLRKLIPQNFAGIIGAVQALINAIRELVVCVLRLLAIFMPAKFNQSMIFSVTTKHNWINGFIEKFKDFFLQVGE